MVSIDASFGRSTGQLKGPGWDSGFVIGIAALALAAAMALTLSPGLFWILLTLDLWLLGYHHVIATFTRFVGDPANAARNRFLIFVLPLLAASATVGLWKLGGLALVIGIYFYWLVFHYTRQSWGIASIYGRKAAHQPDEPAWLVQGVIYLPPLWGLAERSAARPDRFLGAEIITIPTSPAVAHAIGVLAAGVVLLWAGYRIRDALRGRLAGWQTLFLVSHVTLFVVGYVLMPNLDHGWLVVNIWHNTQYLAFVWLANHDRYRGAESASIMARLSRPAAVPAYLALTLALTFTVYLSLERLGPAVLMLGLPAALIYQTINFHHYVVDAVVWRRKRTPKPAAPAPA